jgi:hypothetical protein
MVGITTDEPDNAANVINAKRITSAVYHTASGMLALKHGNAFGASVTRTMWGQQAADLYNALVAIKAGTYTSTT